MDTAAQDGQREELSSSPSTSAAFVGRKVPPLSRTEAYAMMDVLLVEYPVPSTDPKHYCKAVWDASKGYPNAVRDLIWKSSLEKYVDKKHIRGLAHAAGDMYFGPAVVLMMMFWGCITGCIWDIVIRVRSCSRSPVRSMEMRRDDDRSEFP